MKTKPFKLRVVLSVVTERLLTEPKGPRDNGIGDLYEILNWMTNDNLMTHQLPRANGECKPWLLRWFPELTGFANVCEETFAGKGSLDYLLKCAEAAKTSPELALKSWLDRWQVDLGAKASYDVPQIPADDHTVKNPYDELVEMRGTDEGIEIVVPPTTEPPPA